MARQFDRLASHVETLLRDEITRLNENSSCAQMLKWAKEPRYKADKGVFSLYLTAQSELAAGASAYCDSFCSMTRFMSEVVENLPISKEEFLGFEAIARMGAIKLDAGVISRWSAFGESMLKRLQVQREYSIDLLTTPPTVESLNVWVDAFPVECYIPVSRAGKSAFFRKERLAAHHASILDGLSVLVGSDDCALDRLLSLVGCWQGSAYWSISDLLATIPEGSAEAPRAANHPHLTPAARAVDDAGLFSAMLINQFLHMKTTQAKIIEFFQPSEVPEFLIADNPAPCNAGTYDSVFVTYLSIKDLMVRNTERFRQLCSS
jgi:hypothetical protein